MCISFQSNKQMIDYLFGTTRMAGLGGLLTFPKHQLTPRNLRTRKTE